MIFFLKLYKLTAIIFSLAIAVIVSMPHHFTGWRGRRKIIRIQMSWLKTVAKIIGLCVKRHGHMPKVPAGLVVSNHLGYVDIITHGTIFPLRFTSTTVIAKWFFIGQVIALTHPVWVDRTSKPAARKALRDFAKTMKRGMYLIVYPEGTSTDGKHGILPFKSTPFEAAVFGDLPVIPIITRYREVSGKPTVCWYGDMTLMPHLWEVLGLPEIQADIYFLPAIYPEGRSRKELAEYVHGVMAEEYRKITEEKK